MFRIGRAVSTPPAPSARWWVAALAAICVVASGVGAQRPASREPAATPLRVVPQVGHAATVTVAGVAPGGTRLVTGDAIGELRLWTRSIDSGWDVRARPSVHGSAARCVAWTNSGDAFAVGFEGGEIAAFSGSTGTLRWTGRIAGPPRSVMFAGDGGRLLVVGEDGSSAVLSSRSGATQAVPPQTLRVAGGAFAPQGRLLLVETGGELGLWLGSGPQLMRQTAVQTGLARVLTAGGGGDGAIWVLGVMGSGEPEVQRWSLSARGPVRDARLRSVGLGTPAATCRPAVESCVLMLATPGGPSAVTRRRVVFSRAMGPREGTLRLDPETAYPGAGIVSPSHPGEPVVVGVGSQVRVVGGGRDELLAPGGCRILETTLSPDGRWLAAAADDGRTQLWDCHSGRLASLLKAARPPLAFASDSIGTLLVTSGDLVIHPAGAGGSSELTVWHIGEAAGSTAPVAALRHSGAIVALEVSRDGKRIATVDSSRTLRVFERGADSSVWTRRLQELRPEPMSSLVMSPDGSRLVAAGGGLNTVVPGGVPQSSIQTWDLVSGRISQALPGSIGAFPVVRFSPDGRWLGIGGDRIVGGRPAGGQVTLYEGRSYSLRGRLYGHRLTVSGIAFSADGARAATLGRGEDTVIVWDLVTLGTLQALKTGGREVVSTEFLPTRDRLVLRDAAGGVQVWDTTLGAPVVPVNPMGAGIDFRRTVRKLGSRLEYRSYDADGTPVEFQVFPASPTSGPVDPEWIAALASGPFAGSERVGARLKVFGAAATSPDAFKRSEAVRAALQPRG